MTSLGELSRPSPAAACAAYARTYALIAAAVAANVLWPSWPLYLVSVAFIAARQHSLYVLNHDASHGGLFRGLALNRRVATALSNWPMLHHPEAWSFTQWRRVHLLHHAHLFSEGDPNYVGRRLAGDTRRRPDAAGLLAQMALASPQAVRDFFAGRQDYVPPPGSGRAWEKASRPHLLSLIRPWRDDPEMEAERRAALLAYAVLLCAVAVAGAWRLLWLYWLVPAYTVYPAILRLMDLTEHEWTSGGELSRTTNTTVPGLVERLFVSDLNRSYHWEHHLAPGVPCFRLPEASRLLRAAEPEAPAPRPGFLSR